MFDAGRTRLATVNIPRRSPAGLGHNKADSGALMKKRLNPPGAGVGVCSADLDGFKQVSDDLLVAVAGRLRASVLSNDRIVGRLSGDEFVSPGCRARSHRYCGCCGPRHGLVPI